MLHDDNYIKEIKKIIEKCENEYSTLDDRGLAWEMTQMEIRSFSVPYCVKKKKKLEFKQSLEKQLELLQLEIDEHTNDVNRETYYTIKTELEHIEKLEINGQILRSKVKWIEESEKKSRYFLSLEKRNYANKLITTLEIVGKMTKEPARISQEQTTFYQNLYSEKINLNDPNYQSALIEFLQENEIKKLSNDVRKVCKKTINESEILKSKKNLSN